MAKKPLDESYLVHIPQGYGICTLNGQTQEVQPGALLNLDKGLNAELRASCAQPPDLYAVGYQLLDENMMPVSMPLPRLGTINADKRIYDLCRQFKYIWALKKGAYRLTASSLFLQILDWMYSGAGQGQSKYGDARVQQVADYVMSHPGEKINIRELAERVDLHQGYLNKLVMRYTGMTLCSFISKLRVDMAEDLLLHSGLSVGQAAKRCGFRDASHFSHTYRKFKGYPPSHTRQSCE